MSELELELVLELVFELELELVLELALFSALSVMSMGDACRLRGEDSGAFS